LIHLDWLLSCYKFYSPFGFVQAIFVKKYVIKKFILAWNFDKNDMVLTISYLYGLKFFINR